MNEYNNPSFTTMLQHALLKIRILLNSDDLRFFIGNWALKIDMAELPY
jgi:hypothetical protein